MRLGANEVAYTDLILDLWLVDGALRWEDEDELTLAARTGLVTTDDLAQIERARGTLSNGSRRIIAEVRRALALVAPQVAL